MELPPTVEEVAADGGGAGDAKAARRAAAEFLTSYHQAELRALLDHVRRGFVRLDAGEIDEFDLDELIHRYKRAAAKLWTFCNATGSRIESAVNVVQGSRERGEDLDWWERAAASRDERS